MMRQLVAEEAMNWARLLNGSSDSRGDIRALTPGLCKLALRVAEVLH